MRDATANHSACSRRRFLTGSALTLGGLALPARARAFGDEVRFDLPAINYGGPSWNLRPSAVRRLLLELEIVTSIDVVDEPGETTLDADGLFACPTAVLSGDRGFEPRSPAEREALGTWLRAGGLLLVDSSEGRTDGDFVHSVTRELSACIPGESLAPIPDDHVLFRSFYLCDPDPGRVRVAPHLEGITLDGRLAVVVSHNDILGAWARDAMGQWRYQVSGGADRREMAMRFGVNLAMYATCLDYKADQVHVEYLMRRRRWRVDP